MIDKRHVLMPLLEIDKKNYIAITEFQVAASLTSRGDTLAWFRLIKYVLCRDKVHCFKRLLLSCLFTKVTKLLPVDFSNMWQGKLSINPLSVISEKLKHLFLLILAY